ncbi:MAG TPA: hypothetical protein VM240_06320 [Verrucomicrobiae bacterium]|nr:hypothetical protein [Verrucomicrobiae bacterium]
MTELGLQWPLELKEGRRAWTSREAVLISRYDASKVAVLPAHAELRLIGTEKRDGALWWHVEAVAMDKAGRLPEAALTRTWPATRADKLPPMLGDRSPEIFLLRRQLEDPDVRQRIGACKKLNLAGITDEALYDAVAARLVEGLAQTDKANSAAWTLVGQSLLGVGAGAVGDLIVAAARGQAEFNPKHWAQEVAWLTKALGYSGYTKYRPLLERAAETDSFGTYSISKHANLALDDLENFSRWNWLINDPAGLEGGRSAEAARALNLMRSGERQLQRNGLNQIMALKDPTLFDDVEAHILQVYKHPMDGEQEDAVEIMVKVLGRARNPKYRPALVEVAANASAGDVRDMAEDMLELLDRPEE